MPGDGRTVLQHRVPLTVAILAGTGGGIVDRAVTSCLERGIDHIAVFVTSSDPTAAPSERLARRSSVGVHQLGWTDHFGAARTTVVNRLDDRWILFLDADEWLDGDLPESLVDGLDSAYAYAPSIREADQQTRMLGIPRLVHTGSGIVWTRHVHEHCVRGPAEVDVAPRGLDVLLGHDGYRPGPHLSSKQHRNVRLGHLDLEERPGDLRSSHFLVRDSYPTASYEWAHATLQSMTPAPGYTANGYSGGWYIAKTLAMVVHLGLDEGRLLDVLSLLRSRRDHPDDEGGGADVIYYDVMVRSLVSQTTSRDLQLLMDYRAAHPGTGSASLSSDGRHLDAAIVHLLRHHHREETARRYHAQCRPWTDGFFIDSWPRPGVLD